MHLEALGIRVALWILLVTLGGCHYLDGLGSEDRQAEVVIVSGSDRGDCEGFLTFPGRAPKGTLVNCSWLV